jgi:hypothetical protein
VRKPPCRRTGLCDPAGHGECHDAIGNITGEAKRGWVQAVPGIKSASGTKSWRGRVTMKCAQGAVCAAIVTMMSVVGATAKPITTTGETNLRKGPGTDSEVVTLIPKGTMVEVGDCTNGWCQVTWEGQDGYVISRNLGMGGPPRPPRRPVAAQGYGNGPPPGYPPPGYGAPAGYGPPPGYAPAPYVAAPPAYYGYAYPYGYGPYYYGPYWGWRRRW